MRLYMNAATVLLLLLGFSSPTIEVLPLTNDRLSSFRVM